MGEIYYAQAHALRRRGVPTWSVFTDKSQQGGGPLIDIGTHSLDLALWLMDNYEPAAVTGVAFHKLGTTLQPGGQGNFLGTWDPAQYEVEDAAFGFVRMKNGALITLDAVEGIGELVVKPEQAFVVTEILDAVYRSAESGEQIVF